MANREAQARLVPTPLVSSFLGKAHEGVLLTGDLAQREASWAWWAIDSLEEYRGISDREYAALRLPGKFHSPGDAPAPRITPHLEVPQRVLERPDPEFPVRLALAGNALLFPWWLVGEVTAAKRALFNTPRGSLAELTREMAIYQEGLATAVAELSERVRGRWAEVEALLVASPERLVSFATGDATPDEIAPLFPPASGMELSLAFDSQLRESNGKWAARRLAAWQLRGVSGGKSFALGILTPRLTANSLFIDDLFSPATESPAANLVRALLLSRIAREVLHLPSSVSVDAELPTVAQPRPYLRAVVAKVGSKIPEASVEAAAHFVQSFKDADEAWFSLEEWASSGYILTVSQDAFTSAFDGVRKFVRRSDSPPRELIDAMLPLAWDSRGRVVRVTFARPAGQGTADG